MVVAGEASGDLHAANMVRALRRLRPELRFSGMGGGALRDAGVEILVDSTRLAVVGLVEVLAHYGDIRRALNTLKHSIEREPPRLLVLVDYVEFNLRLARFAKGKGVKVLFYVSPQVWAWRARRVRRIGQVIDAMAVLFPFEEAVYRKHGIPVRYVGNPLVDEVRASADCYTLRRGFGLNETAPVVGILPGSRRGELRRHLPLIMESARLLRSRIPSVQFIMPIRPRRGRGAGCHVPRGRQPGHRAGEWSHLRRHARQRCPDDRIGHRHPGSGPAAGAHGHPLPGLTDHLRHPQATDPDP